MIIDSHQHFWKYEPLKHVWIDDEMANIRRDFMPEDLKPIYKEDNVLGCVAVQADQSLQENDFLLGLSKKHEFIKGVVGWVDFRSKEVEKYLEAYCEEQKMKGFRHVVQGEADHNFLLRPDFLNGIDHLKKFGYTYDILIFPHQLGATLEFVKNFPDQKFVIDHLAKPYIKDGFFEGWAAMMKEIAKQENVYCKISGMITEANYSTWTPEQLKPYMELVLETFGPNRLMYGSDWPVCLVAGKYSKVKEVVTDFIAELSSNEQDAIMGKNAMFFYNL
ncbi:amidohydrolase family protein [Croceitalea marina]|uniref:Amidohydrolase family protein n=1 Tax=Croceitalea marina TaxID=1775166 RepID=A0ABW5MX68_9FLAO